MIRLTVTDIFTDTVMDSLSVKINQLPQVASPSSSSPLPPFPFLIGTIHRCQAQIPDLHPFISL